MTTFGRALLRLSVWAMLGLGLHTACSSNNDCPQICTPYAQQCSAQGILVCAQSVQTSCFNWAILPCPPGTVCKQLNNQYTCEPSQADCSNPQHTKACVGQDVYWFDACGKRHDKVLSCPEGTTCLEAQCKPKGDGTCSTVCSFGAKRCKAGNQIEMCQRDQQGCSVWRDLETCPNGNVCRNGGCFNPNEGNSNNQGNQNNGGCTNECQPNAVQCLGSAYQTCAQGTDGCYRWGQAVACPSGQTCKDGRCQPTSGPCQNECNLGHQRCLSNQYQVCEKVGECNTWGQPQSCGSGQQCKATPPTIDCTCLPGYLPAPDGNSCYPSNNQNNNGGSQNNNNGGSQNNNNGGSTGNCSMNSLEKQVLDIVNQERQKAGQSPVQCNAKLVDAARQWSAAQCKQGGLSHANLGSRVQATGLSVSGYGENVAYGSKTASGVMNMWMNSSGHRRNILSSTYSHLGVGLDTCNGRYFWTQIFVRMR